MVAGVLQRDEANQLENKQISRSTIQADWKST